MAVMIIVFFHFIFLFANTQDLIMQQHHKLLFENKIGCVANLLGFNGGQREILKTACWISLNDMMLSQSTQMTDDDFHTAEWLLVIRTGKNVETFLNVNKTYASNDLWQEFSKTQANNTQLLQLIDYMVERCR